MSLPKMNHTQISNAFIDNWMHQLNPSATLVFLAISRKTIGWHKDTDAISLTTIQEMTGFSRQGVINAIDDLEKAGLIEAIRHDKKTTKYSINYETVESVDQSNECTSQLSRLHSQLSGLDEGEKQANLVNSVDTQKKDKSFKETKQKKVCESTRFTKPKLEEVVAYCQERKNTVDPMKFMAYYEANGWRVGKTAMKDWKSAVIYWEKNNTKPTYSPPIKARQIEGLNMPEQEL